MHIGYDEELAHHIEAGCDMYLMPSMREPCGLNQLYSLRYGTVPIVRETGGLADAVIDYRKPKGNGFLFKNYNPDELYKSVMKAISVFKKDSKKWHSLIRNGMMLDYSWKVSAKKYMALYKNLLTSK